MAPPDPLPSIPSSSLPPAPPDRTPPLVCGSLPRRLPHAPDQPARSPRVWCRLLWFSLIDDVDLVIVCVVVYVVVLFMFVFV